MLLVGNLASSCARAAENFYFPASGNVTGDAAIWESLDDASSERMSRPVSAMQNGSVKVPGRFRFAPLFLPSVSCSDISTCFSIRVWHCAVWCYGALNRAMERYDGASGRCFCRRFGTKLVVSRSYTGSRKKYNRWETPETVLAMTLCCYTGAEEFS